LATFALKGRWGGPRCPRGAKNKFTFSEIGIDIVFFDTFSGISSKEGVFSVD